MFRRNPRSPPLPLGKSRVALTQPDQNLSVRRILRRSDAVRDGQVWAEGWG
jgi:hypothetical protein